MLHLIVTTSPDCATTDGEATRVTALLVERPATPAASVKKRTRGTVTDLWLCPDTTHGSVLHTQMRTATAATIAVVVADMVAWEDWESKSVRECVCGVLVSNQQEHLNMPI